MTWFRSALLPALLLGRVAAADPAVLTLRLQIDPAAGEARVGRRDIAASAPFTPGADIPIGAQARPAYEAAVRRLSHGNSPENVLLIRVTGISGRFESSDAAWRASVEHEISVADSAGSEIAHWKVQGVRATFRSEEDAAVAAFAAASEDAVRAVESRFTQSGEIGAWMRRHGGEPLSERSRWPDRGELVTFIDGGALVSTAGDSMSPAYSLRAGVSTSRYLFQVVAAKMSAPFTANPVFGISSGEANLSSAAFGLEAGLVLRGRMLELRAGAGGHWLQGHTNMSYQTPALGGQTAAIAFPYRALVPGVFAALQFADIVLPGGSRIRFGVEARHYFAPDDDYPELRRSASAAATAFGVLAGMEFPWRPSRH